MNQFHAPNTFLKYLSIQSAGTIHQIGTNRMQNEAKFFFTKVAFRFEIMRFHMIFSKSLLRSGGSVRFKRSERSERLRCGRSWRSRRFQEVWKVQYALGGLSVLGFLLIRSKNIFGFQRLGFPLYIKIEILRSCVLWLHCGMHIGGTSIFDCLNHCKKPLHIGIVSRSDTMKHKQF